MYNNLFVSCISYNHNYQIYIIIFVQYSGRAYGLAYLENCRHMGILNRKIAPGERVKKIHIIQIVLHSVILENCRMLIWSLVYIS